MKPAITIYTETYRDSSIYADDDNDARIYDKYIDSYFDVVKHDAEIHGHTVILSKDHSDFSYITSNSDAQNYMDFINEFWDWFYNESLYC